MWVLFAASLSNCSCWTEKIRLLSHLFKWTWPVAFEILALRGALYVFVFTVDRTKSSHCYTAGLIDLEVDFSPEPTFPSLIHCKNWLPDSYSENHKSSRIKIRRQQSGNHRSSARRATAFLLGTLQHLCALIPSLEAHGQSKSYLVKNFFFIISIQSPTHE